MANHNKQTVFLPLEDVESEHCALIVDKGLAKVKGLESHKVELNNRRAEITVNNSGSGKSYIVFAEPPARRLSEVNQSPF